MLHIVHTPDTVQERALSRHGKEENSATGTDLAIAVLYVVHVVGAVVSLVQARHLAVKSETIAVVEPSRNLRQNILKVLARHLRNCLENSTTVNQALTTERHNI